MDFNEKSKKVSKYPIKNDETNIGGPQSILTIIDDKNKIIHALKKQIVNQKIQLNYYLHKSLDEACVAEFKKYCIPTYVDENVRINMAMCKFYKETQIKTPIRNLFEQMFDIDRRLHNTLTQQENMVQIILDIIMKFAKNCIEGSNAEIQLKSFLQYFNQFQIFNDLLTATKNLQNDINTMRIYCNRLVVIEDERNSLVDQIYSKPLDQQSCSNYVISVVSDRKTLEHELRSIKDEMQNFIHQMPMLAKQDLIGKKFSKSEKESLENVIEWNPEKYQQEFSKLKIENNALQNKVKSLQKMLDNKIDMENKLIELEKKCEILKDRCKNIEKQNSTVSSSKSMEVRAMEIKINKLQEKILMLKSQSIELKALRRNLSYYKTQAEVLEVEKRSIQQNKVEVVNDLNAKLEGHKDVINLLKKQIQYLLLLLYYMKEDGKNKKTMEEMNRTVSIILSDIDILLLKTEENQQQQYRSPLDIIAKDYDDNILKLDSNDAEFKSGCCEEESALPLINSMCKKNINNILTPNYANSTIQHGAMEGTVTYTMDYEAGVNTSLKVFVRKFDEIAQNINRILNNLAEKQ